jgi:hypothetical protein
MCTYRDVCPGNAEDATEGGRTGAKTSCHIQPPEGDHTHLGCGGWSPAMLRTVAGVRVATLRIACLATFPSTMVKWGGGRRDVGRGGSRFLKSGFFPLTKTVE